MSPASIQAILAVARNAFVSLDAEGRVREWNNRAEELFGYTRSEALDTVLPWLSEKRCTELACECVELYCWDRLGVDN